MTSGTLVVVTFATGSRSFRSSWLGCGRRPCRPAAPRALVHVPHDSDAALVEGDEWLPLGSNSVTLKQKSHGRPVTWCSGSGRAGGDTSQPEGEMAAGHNAPTPLPGGCSMSCRSPRSRAVARSSCDRQEPAHLHQRSTCWVLVCRRLVIVAWCLSDARRAHAEGSAPPWTTRPAAPDTEETRWPAALGQAHPAQHRSRHRPDPPMACFYRESTPCTRRSMR
jgi:hypothetical protein